MGTLRDLQFALQLKIEELRQRDTLIDELELELDTKDELIRRLQEELDRYRATISLPGPSAVSAASPSQDENNLRAKRKTVISESVTPDPDTFATMLHRNCDKSQKSQRLIQAAFGKNALLKNLDEGEMRAIIACMYPTSFQPGSYVFEEGTKGAQAYVLEEGRLNVTRDGVKLYTAEAEDMFGEMSLLYNCTHTYSVAAQTDSQLWVIERRSYQTILTQRAIDSLHRSSELLSRVSYLQSLPENIMMKMSEVMQEAHYSEGDYIIRQEALGDTFYVISKGQVKVTEMKPGREEQLVLSTLSETQWFGEKALWGNDVRTVNVIAAGDVTCLLIDRETFRDVSGGLVFDSRPEVMQNVTSKHDSDEDLGFLLPATLRDFQIVCTLGVGEFGHVDLVQLRSDHKCLFAMRVVEKKLVLSSGQQELVLRERNILKESHCPFIVRLHKTFRDAECIYMLTEACLCGDLHSLLMERGCLDECNSRFYTACVTEAVSFLHSQSVICRDIKPETVVLDHRGYAKLTGSRCWKKVDRGKKTYTFCGTPGFMAPEVILNKGHSRAADFWSLGVFVFELLSGRLPICGADTLMTLTLTLCGIDQIDFPKTISQSASSLIKELCRCKLWQEQNMLADPLNKSIEIILAIVCLLTFFPITRHNPSERLGSRRNGAKDIQKHKWFEGFNWDRLCAGSLSPPLLPKVKHLLDTSTPAHYSSDPTELSTTWADF